MPGGFCIHCPKGCPKAHHSSELPQGTGMGTTWVSCSRPRHQQRNPGARLICVGHRHGIERFRLVPTFAQQSPTELASAVEGGRDRCVRRTKGVQKKRLYIPPPLYHQICSVRPLCPAPIPHLGRRLYRMFSVVFQEKGTTSHRASFRPLGRPEATGLVQQAWAKPARAGPEAQGTPGILEPPVAQCPSSSIWQIWVVLPGRGATTIIH